MMVPEYFVLRATDSIDAFFLNYALIDRCDGLLDFVIFRFGGAP